MIQRSARSGHRSDKLRYPWEALLVDVGLRGAEQEHYFEPGLGVDAPVEGPDLRPAAASVKRPPQLVGRGAQGSRWLAVSDLLVDVVRLDPQRPEVRSPHLLIDEPEGQLNRSQDALTLAMTRAIESRADVLLVGK